MRRILLLTSYRLDHFQHRDWTARRGMNPLRDLTSKNGNRGEGFPEWKAWTRVERANREHGQLRQLMYVYFPVFYFQRGFSYLTLLLM